MPRVSVEEVEEQENSNFAANAAIHQEARAAAQRIHERSLQVCVPFRACIRVNNIAMERAKHRRRM